MKYKTEAIILAGGKGKRMGGDIPKPLLPLDDEVTILESCLNTLRKSRAISRINIVYGSRIKEYLENPENNNVDRVLKTIHRSHARQLRQFMENGTAAATAIGMTLLDADTTHVLVLCADDAGLYKAKTITEIVESFYYIEQCMSFLVTEQDQPTDIGGLLIDEQGCVTDILTKGGLEREGITRPKVACGAFSFKRKWLEENIGKLEPSKLSGEYTLPSLLWKALEQNQKVGFFPLRESEWNSVNTPEELEEARKKYENKI